MTHTTKPHNFVGSKVAITDTGITIRYDWLNAKTEGIKEAHIAWEQITGSTTATERFGKRLTINTTGRSYNINYTDTPKDKAAASKIKTEIFKRTGQTSETERQTPTEEFAGWKLTAPHLTDPSGNRYTLTGAHAEVEASGDMGKRTTATRVITGGVLFGPAGAVVGGLIRKSRNQIYITITFPNGDTGLIEAPAKQETDARRFAVAINNAAR